MEKKFKVLTINPGSTSTKIGVYENDELLFEHVIRYTSDDLSQYKGSIIEQYEFRKNDIENALKEKGIPLDSMSAMVGRGGLLKPIPSGTYLVNEAMLNDLKNEINGSHASNLGAIIAYDLAEKVGINAYVVDPVVVDELDDVARITGRPEIMRRSIFHALNQKAVAKRLAKSLNKPYEELNIIVAHLGGGISVGTHRKGRIVEVNNAFDGEGPFTPERSGTMQAKQFVDLVLENQWNDQQIAKALVGNGGLVAHLGTNDVRDVIKNIESGDDHAKLVFDAMIYQVCRYIGAAAIPLKGKVDYIILTGGIIYSDYVSSQIKETVEYLGEVVLMPGEDELQALAEGAMRVLLGQEEAKIYC